MKRLFSSRGLFLLGFVVLATANIVVLAGVGYNRSGSRESSVVLTERELQPPYRTHAENSGVRLRLVWRVLGEDTGEKGYPRWGPPAWLTEDKLADLGFRLDEKLGAGERRDDAKTPLPKEVFIVLEMDGASYREAVRRAERAFAYESELAGKNRDDRRLQEAKENAAKVLARERVAESRLFAVDAGLDPEALRATYADRSRYIIAKGLIRPSYDTQKGHRRFRGTIARLSVENVHVPLEHRQAVDAALTRKALGPTGQETPRYAVELAYGRRCEPWIVAIKALAKMPPIE